MAKTEHKSTSQPDHADPLDSLGAIYEDMYERVVDRFHKAKDKTAPQLLDWITEAKHKAMELDELTDEDAKKLTIWLKRDFDDMLHHLSETEAELEEWLGFEATLFKSTLIQKLLDVADKTTLELLRMKENIHQPSSYHTGEITGPGTLICDECQEILHFHQSGRIPPCPKCNSIRFHRILIE